MVGYAHARKIEGLRPDLSFLAGGLHLPWVTMVFLTGFIIEAMLAGRLWLQLNNQDVGATGLKALLISVTDTLVSPFRGYESTVLTERSNGVFEFSTLVAVEAYLIGTLGIVLAIVAIRFMSFFTEQAVALKKRHDLRVRSRITLQRRTPIRLDGVDTEAPVQAEAGTAVPAPKIAAAQAQAAATKPAPKIAAAQAQAAAAKAAPKTAAAQAQAAAAKPAPKIDAARSQAAAAKPAPKIAASSGPEPAPALSSAMASSLTASSVPQNAEVTQ